MIRASIAHPELTFVPDRICAVFVSTAHKHAFPAPLYMKTLLRKPDTATRSPMLLHTGRLLLTCIVWIVCASTVYAQTKTLDYTIRRNADIIGHIRVTRMISGSTTTYTLESRINAKLILPILADTREESVFEHGIMTRSVMYRQMNGKERANKTTTRRDGHYIVQQGRKSETLSIAPIRHNMMSMYFTEPTDLAQVYSDGFQQYCPIDKLGSQHYLVRFPKREQTEFFYQNGICVKLRVQSALGEVMVELKGR